MNILYISNLDGRPWAGPTFSVPNQIAAQAAIDNVFWYNIYDGSHPEWISSEWEKLCYYHDLRDYPDQFIRKFPEPFNHPDLVVVEQFYNMTLSRFRKQLVCGDIPYVIIPRGELTKQAQSRKRLKKYLANLIICRRFAKKAVAVQYLTEQEYKDSGEGWNLNHIVIANGIKIPSKERKASDKREIRCISIGRIEPYQKGLDLLIDACSKIKDELQLANCKITICGPDRVGKLQWLKERITALGLADIISFKKAAYGHEKEVLLVNSDVFLMTSRFEGHPMALIEAMSYGIPCVVTTGSNMRNEVEKYNAGWAADCTSSSIADALSRMISCEDYLIKGRNAKELARNYDWNVIAAQTHSLYVKLCT